MFQHKSLAQAIREGHALYVCLVEMNGRLAFPIQDELLGRLDELREIGIDKTCASEGATWTG
jgi:hypothetical protein